MITKNPNIQLHGHQQRRTAIIRVADYLARYARQKFDTDPKTGGIKIQDSFNLYHCVWQLMAKWPLEHWHIGVSRHAEIPQGNLAIHLPFRRSEGGVTKDPRFWNYLSPRSASIIGRELKRLFDWEFHHYVETLQEFQPEITKKEAVSRFIQKYGLGIDAEDALLKNLQRHERKNRIFLGLNKVKSTTTSPTTLSCRIPYLLRRPCMSDDDATTHFNNNSLVKTITEGLISLGEHADNEYFKE